MSERHELHDLQLTTVEMAGVLACVMATLADDKPNGEFDMLSASLRSAADKISVKLRVPVIISIDH